jgi:hypothetical protein
MLLIAEEINSLFVPSRRAATSSSDFLSSILFFFVGALVAQ